MHGIDLVNHYGWVGNYVSFCWFEIKKESPQGVFYPTNLDRTCYDIYNQVFYMDSEGNVLKYVDVSE
jgi:hypothetical protein